MLDHGYLQKGEAYMQLPNWQANGNGSRWDFLVGMVCGCNAKTIRACRTDPSPSSSRPKKRGRALVAIGSSGRPWNGQDLFGLGLQH